MEVADFKDFNEFVSTFHERYDGVWVAAMRCVCKCDPRFDWNVIEAAHAESHHLSPFEGDLPFADKDVVANADP